MIEDLIRRLRALDLLETADMPGDQWAEQADEALQEAADALEQLHRALVIVAKEARTAIDPRRMN